jgi:hypothetical protein
MTLLTRMSSQTDFLIILHVDRTGPPNSPYLNPCDYILWGFLKEKIFFKTPQTIMELRALIIRVCNEIIEEVCLREINITIGVEVARRNGGHIELLIHRR